MPAGIGDNSIGSDASKVLKDAFARLEALADDAAAIREDVKTIAAELKDAGFKPAAVKKLVALRAKDREKVIADKETLELYAVALGVSDLV